MIKCPFCHYENEDGALFCERCSSDLSTVAPTPAAVAPPPSPYPFPEAPAAPALGLDDSPFAQPIEEPFAEALPMAEPEPFDFAPPAAVPADPEPEPFAFAPPPLELTDAPPPIAEAPHPVMDPAPPAIPETMEPATEMAPSPPPPPPAPTPMVEAAPPAMAVPAPTPAPAAMAPGAEAGFPPGAEPRLLVLRGQKRNVEYPIFEGPNYVGRADEKPVDIDLEEQEPPDRIWCSRQHAVINFDSGVLTLEDLNSANGTYVNRARVYPGQPKALAVNDVIQIGNVQLKVVV